MDIRQLRYFSAVARAGSFSRAALHINVAQSALSLHVKQLEQRLGVRLLERSRTGIHMTEAGIRLLHHASDILDRVAEAEADLLSRSDAPKGDVTIGLPSGLTAILAPQVLSAIAQAYPQVTVHIVEAMTGALEEKFGAGELDLALLYRSPGDRSSGFELLQEEFHLISRPDLAPEESEVALGDLRTFPLAAPRSGHMTQRIIREAVDAVGVTLNIAFELDSLTAILALVEQGGAHAILARTACSSELASRRLRSTRIVSPSITRSIFLEENASLLKSYSRLSAKKVLVDVARNALQKSID